MKLNLEINMYNRLLGMMRLEDILNKIKMSLDAYIWCVFIESISASNIKIKVQSTIEGGIENG